jgi:hypothetical protein
MAKRKVTAAEVDPELDWTPSAEWLAIQLTPKQKAAARRAAEAKATQARRDGVYEHFLALVGKVRLDYDLDELREDRD